ncbi:hypothetical protein [Roseateles sp.]|uniref:hypothetical protein n=1 Tax=Roseateles sp. TaxID=1971397 RepID=UPI0039E8695C
MKPHHLSLAAALLAGCMAGAQAQATIDQNKALAGNVTPGDTPGFPVTLNQPGSYRLTGNLTVPEANTTAILITSPNVTLDLGGYAILGPCAGGCGSSSLGDGVALALPNPSPGIGLAAIEIANGTVRGMGRYGINGINTLHGGSYGALRVERMRLLNNRYGISIAGGGSVANSDISGNVVALHGNSVALRHNDITRNSTAFSLNSDSSALGNVIQGNGTDALASVRNLGGNLCGTALCP